MPVLHLPRATTALSRKCHSLQRERTARDIRGAVLLEAAIVFLPLCIVLFGIIEYGYIFKDSLTLSSATRSGARTASAEPGETTFYSDTIAAVVKAAGASKFDSRSVLLIYEASASSGLPAGGTESTCGSTNCIRYQWNGSTFVWASGTWPTSAHQACMGGTINSVGVSLTIAHDAASGFFHGLMLTERTAMKLEPMSYC